MKKFMEPEIEVIRFKVADILTTSDDSFPILPLSAPDNNSLGLTSLD